MGENLLFLSTIILTIKKEMSLNIAPIISIVIPVYNGTNYLREAIDSALAQTYTEYEVLVIDDGSIDGTWDLIQSYGERIRSFRKPNGGVASALNLGIREMRGQWFAWLSHDDLFSRNRIQEDMVIVKNNPDAKVIFCKTNVINANSEIVKEIEYPIQHVSNPREVFMLDGMHMCAMTIHKSCFSLTGLFNENNQTTQDVEMTLRLSCEYQFYFNSQSITSMRIHPESGTYTLNEQHKKDMSKLCSFIHEELSVENFFPDLMEDEKNKAWIWMGDLYWNFGARQYAEEAYQIVISSQNNWLYRWFISTYIILSKVAYVRNAYIFVSGIVLKVKRFFNLGKKLDFKA